MTLATLLVGTLTGCHRPQPEQVVEFALICFERGSSGGLAFGGLRCSAARAPTEQPGFLRRQLVKKSGSEYVDIVYWDNQHNADQAAARAMESDVCYAYFQLMEEVDHNDPAAGVIHYEVLGVY